MTVAVKRLNDVTSVSVLETGSGGTSRWSHTTGHQAVAC
jgi:hypothetical protein